jgi:uncharacterized protein (TIGR02145 family)
MKKLVLLFALFATLLSCSKKESDIKDLTPKKNNNPAVASTGEVQFQPQMIDLVNGNINARLEAADAATILVTIVDDKGVIVKNKVSIKLSNFNGSYISQPLVLKDGVYKLKEFLVLDAANNVLYATPLTGSALASVVTTSLPMTFTVINQKLSTVIPQVVSTLTKTAGNFGYLTFNFAVIETLDFNLAVFAFNKTTVAYELVTSDVALKNGSTEMYKGIFPANIEAISIKDEKAGTYTLTVAKTGYKTYTGTYTYADLKAAFDDPINVILEEAPVATTVTDIDGNVYPIVTIGTQTWMGENLRVEKYNDGTSIPLETDQAKWLSNYQKQTYLPMMSWYDNNKDMYMANKYGALYNGVVVNSQKLCPAGWHVPTVENWTTLSDFLGGEASAGLKLKSKNGWDGTNEVNFNALPSGNRVFDKFDAVEDVSSWWSATGDDHDLYLHQLQSNYDGVISNVYASTMVGISVRCVRD